MRLVCISDTHTKHRHVQLPDGDILIHAGDASFQGSRDELTDLAKWMGFFPHKIKLFTPGNHDFYCQNYPKEAKTLFNSYGVQYYVDEDVIIGMKHIYMAPWTPIFFDWAFMADAEMRKKKWDLIPDGIDILVTHGPPKGILDRTKRGEHVGCDLLADKIFEKMPKYHIFGHIHEAYGQLKSADTHYINASICTLNYQPTNKPIVLDI